MGVFKRPIVATGLIGFTAIFGIYASDTRAGIYPNIIMPFFHLFDPEDTHRWSILLAKYVCPWERVVDDKKLAIKLFGKSLTNPIGLAAGYDKHAEAIDSMFNLGFGMVEVGSITPKPQIGNPKPRVFRLDEDGALINRYGFNSDGHEVVYERLKSRLIRNKFHNNINEKSGHESKLLGVNLGKNKTSPPESDDDYIDGVGRLGPLADYIVINISSPNTPGLRALQRREPIERLLKSVIEKRNEIPHLPPLLVKIAPDLSDSELEDIAYVVNQVGVDGVIISNTTLQRPNLKNPDKKQIGGLSGKPLHQITLETIKKFYRLSNVPIIGCGGISSGKDALEFCKAGASAVQLYTSMGYYGPGIATKVKQELVQLLGDSSWSEMIGTGNK